MKQWACFCCLADLKGSQQPWQHSFAGSSLVYNWPQNPQLLHSWCDEVLKMNLLWPQGRSVSKIPAQVWGEKLGAPWMLKLETLRRILVMNWYFYLNSGWFRCRYHWSLRCPPCEWIYFGLLFFSWCRWYSPFPVKHAFVLGSNFQGHLGILLNAHRFSRLYNSTQVVKTLPLASNETRRGEVMF